MKFFYILCLSVLLLGCSNKTPLVEENRVSIGKIVDIKIVQDYDNSITSLITESNVITYRGRINILPRNEEIYIIYCSDGSKHFTWPSSQVMYQIKI